MSIKISAMTAASALGGTEAFEGVQSGNTRKITAAQIATYVASVQAVTAPIVNTSGTLSISAASPSAAGSQSAQSADLTGSQTGVAGKRVDFIDTVSGNEILTTSVAGGTVAGVASVADHPGIVTHSVALTATPERAGMSFLANLTQVSLQAGQSLEVVVNVVTLGDGTDEYVFLVGGWGTFAYSSIANGIFLEYKSATATTWRGITFASSSTTVASGGTPVTVTTGWHRLKIVINAAATQVDYYVDGVLIGSCTATIPTLANNFGFGSNMQKTLGTTARTAQVDYAQITWTLSGTAAR